MCVTTKVTNKSREKITKREREREMPRLVDDVDIQRKVITFIADELGDKIWFSAKGSRTKTGKHGIFERAFREIAPTASHSTISRWWEYFLQNGETQADKRKRERDSGKRDTPRRYRGRWNSRQRLMLQQIVDEHPEFYLDEIQFRLYKMGGGWWSRSYIWKKLRYELKYSLQIATTRSYDIDVVERDKFMRRVKEIIIHARQLMFLDETAKGKNSGRRRRHWSRQGLTPFRYIYFNGSHGKTYTMLSACDIDGFLLDECECVEPSRGPNDDEPVSTIMYPIHISIHYHYHYHVPYLQFIHLFFYFINILFLYYIYKTRGTVDAERFRLWLRTKVLPKAGNFQLGQPRSIIVLDNAQIHRLAKEIIEAESNAICIYLPAYSPDLNPIEMMFHSYKQGLKRYAKLPHHIAHRKSLQTVTPAIACSYFKKSQVPKCDHYMSIDLLKKKKKEEETLLCSSMMTTTLLSAVVAHICTSKK